MDIVKGGWHPSGDKQIHRATWKKDLKGMVSRKDEQADRAKSHVSTPLDTLKDPESFGPPPKHTAYYPDARPALQSASSATRPSDSTTGLGAPVPVASRARQSKQEEQEKKPAGPYKVNTTGLKTDHLPKPPGRGESSTPTSITTTAARPVPALPSRQATAGPPPVLPPRQTETPNEYTPAAPPPYAETNPTAQNPAVLNAGSLKRLGQSGVSVPGLGIGNTSAQPQPAQMNELQQRFARMNGGSSPSSQGPASTPNWKQAHSSMTALKNNPTAESAGRQAVTTMQNNPEAANAGFRAAASAVRDNPAIANAGLQAAANAASQKKKPPPPPTKKLGNTNTGADDASAPPPIPMSSKPRPG